MMTPSHLRETRLRNKEKGNEDILNQLAHVATIQL